MNKYYNNINNKFEMGRSRNNIKFSPKAKIEQKSLHDYQNLKHLRYVLYSFCYTSSSDHGKEVVDNCILGTSHCSKIGDNSIFPRRPLKRVLLEKAT